MNIVNTNPEPDDMANWTRPAFSASQVNRAGNVFRAQPRAPFSEVVDAYDVLENWRAAHGYPLNSLQMNLRNHAKKTDPAATVSQRLKRLESVIRKLKLMPTLKMSQMQDIGGCRAVLDSIPKVHDMATRFGHSRMRHELVGSKDYIATPKKDGYRSIHLVYKFFGSAAEFNGLRVEVQLRSRSQHMWATAVEAAGAITKQALKSNQGSEDWLRFFALMSSVIAHRERQPTVPETPSDTKLIREELLGIENRVHVLDTLDACRIYEEQVVGANSEAVYHLVHLIPEDHMVKFYGFTSQQFALANQRYTALEREIAEGGRAEQAALVSSKTIAELRRAYPNFRLDTRKFREMATQFLGLR